MPLPIIPLVAALGAGTVGYLIGRDSAAKRGCLDDLGNGLGFFRTLDEPQRGILLEYIAELRREWGAGSAMEWAELGLRDEIGEDVIEHDDNTSIEVLCSMFESRANRVAFLMELVRVGMASREFDPERSELVERTARAFSFDEDGTMQAILVWLHGEREMIEKVQQLMEEKCD